MPDKNPSRGAVCILKVRVPILESSIGVILNGAVLQAGGKDLVRTRQATCQEVPHWLNGAGFGRRI